jgi:Fe2+ or Zn2+ uptake regulation protein
MPNVTPRWPGVLSVLGEPVDPRAEIVAYLRARPSAGDSLEGIIDWWLPRQRYETAKAAIQRALDDLARQGIVEEVTLGNGVRLYRLARRLGTEQ